MSTVQLNLLKSSVNANIDLFNAQEDVRKSLQAISESKSSEELIKALVKAAAIEASGWESAYNQVGGNYDNGPDYKPPKVNTGGGSKADKLGDLNKQLGLERELLYLSEAQKRVINALGDDRGKYSAETIRGLVAEVEAIDKVNKKLEEQKSLSDKVSSSMSDAFMSIADGTTSASDAFRTMAADIIRELYKVLVVQKLVGSLTSIIGGGSGGGMFGNFTNVSANGNVFSGGSQVKAYANGGVVGRPTVFPMANGGVGLMGEAGPEAIMPLKRGANGKLGVQAEGGSGSGGVVIHQNFNFAANGDESVKRIIAQAAPHIANMTQKQIMDSRRRGGAMKATFS
jgi:phage-related minor tail protein